MNAQGDNVYFPTFFLFSFQVLCFRYMLDGNIRYQLTAYTTGSFGHATMWSTVTVVTTVVVATEQIVFARLTDSVECIGI